MLAWPRRSGMEAITRLCRRCHIYICWIGERGLSEFFFLGTVNQMDAKALPCPCHAAGDFVNACSHTGSITQCHPQTHARTHARTHLCSRFLHHTC